MIKRINIDPNICHGKPIIKGTRVLVSNILSELSVGKSFDEIIENYPNITKEDIEAALKFGSYLSNYETYPYDVKSS